MRHGGRQATILTPLISNGLTRLSARDASPQMAQTPDGYIIASTITPPIPAQPLRIWQPTGVSKMAEASVSELNERFASGGKELEPDVVAELQSTMRMHELSSQDLFFKWESYCIKLDIEEMQPSLDRLRAFKKDLQDALERSNRTQAHIKTEKRAGATPRAAVNNGDVFSV